MGNAYSARQSTMADGNVITAALFNNEFDQIVLAFNTSGHAHDGTAGEGGNITALRGHALTFGLGTAGTDVVVTFDGETNDGVLSWMEDEDYFQFSDDVLLATTEKLQFRDTAIYINSSTDGQLDIVADTEVQIAATTVDINGNVDISGTLTVGAGLDFAEQAIANVGNIALDSISGDADSDTSITFSGSDVITIAAGGSTRAVVNTSGLDVTGTVTADGLNVDTSNSFATINVGTSYLDVIGTDATSGLRLSNTNNSTAGQADILFQRTENPVVNGTNTGIGQMLFEADNSGGSPFLFAGITTYANQFTAGSEEAFFAFTVEDGTGSRNEKLRINKDGIDVTGTVTADGINIGDDQSIYVGAGNDLQIIHNNSGRTDILETGSGNLRIAGRAIEINNDTGTNEYQIVLDGEGSTNRTRLYAGQPSDSSDYKLATTSTGVDVKGTITSDGLSIGDASSTEGAGEAISIGAGGDLKLFHKSDVSYIHESGASALNIQAANLNISTGTANDDSDPDEYYRITTTAGTGYVRLYHGETTDFNGHKFQTKSTGVEVIGSIILTDSSGNSTTLQEGASGDITLTLPSATGTLALTASPTFTGTVTTAALDINGTVDIDTGNTIFDVDTGTSTVHFKSTELGEQFLIENNNSGSSIEGAPDLTLFCNQPNDVSDNDTLGVINFKGLNDAGANYTYAKLFATSPDVSDGDEKGKVTVRIQHSSGGTDTLTNALEIHKDGIDVTGEVSIGDASSAAGAENRLNIGANGELLIYHNGNDSYIKENDGSGSLTIQGQNIFIKNTDGTKNFIHTDSNQDVRLSFDGSTKLQTTTGGIFVTGAVVAGAQGATTGGQIKFREGTDNGTNATTLQAPADAGASGLTINLPSSAGTLALKHSIVGDAMSTSTSTIAHDTVKTYVGKTFVHNGGGDVTLELPAVGSDVSIGDQIDLVNASTTAGAEIILDIAHSSNTTQTVRICTGSDVTEENANDPHIQKGGVVTLLAIAANTYALFGSGIEDN